MSIRFQCPHCNSIRAANERMAGKKIRCPVCSGNVQLPTLEEIAAAEREAQQLQALQSQLGTIESNANRANYSSPAPQQGTNSAATEENAEEAMVFEKKKNRDDSEMDMTPMVDVTFLLLIFFMITASFSIQKVFRTPAQKSNEASTKAEPDPNQDNADSVVVQIDEFNSYTVLLPSGEEREIPSKQDLIVLLSEAKGEGDGGPSKLVIRAHEDSTHSTVVAALDAGRDANFEKFELTTIEELE
ncbi:MAG: biopolymer transporter ExbD [Planctomycetes bacterium]|nr:biopolymer transporter ExbD [Planctomycetota bacterium]